MHSLATASPPSPAPCLGALLRLADTDQRPCCSSGATHAARPVRASSKERGASGVGAVYPLSCQGLPLVSFPRRRRPLGCLQSWGVIATIRPLIARLKRVAPRWHWRSRCGAQSGGIGHGLGSGTPDSRSQTAPPAAGSRCPCARDRSVVAGDQWLARFGRAAHQPSGLTWLTIALRVRLPVRRRPTAFLLATRRTRGGEHDMLSFGEL
jgi:hypothetical protein